MITAYRAILASILLSTLLSACTEEAPLPPPESRPVKTMVVGGTSAGDFRQFPGVVDAIQKADLSFRVEGKLREILVREGDMVKQGQLLASLDPTDYQIVLNDRKASYFTAKANLEAAEQNLQYTSLKAKFDGYVAKRHVENFEEVRGKQTVFTLQDISELEIEVDIPESLMILLRPAGTPEERKQRARDMYAVFDQIRDVKFPLGVKEIATTADPNTRTFKATLTMENPENYNILPGMTATVFAEVFASEGNDVAAVDLPLSAVVADADKDATVWIVDESTMTVRPRAVQVGLMTADSISVTGLEAGERVVTAGAAFMREGMKVTLLQTGEQPDNRP